jgi:hypothetical protein
MTADQANDAAHCLHYLQGITDSYYFFRDRKQFALTGGDKTIIVLPKQVHPEEYAFCLPDGYTNVQGVQVVVKYLNEHPEQLHFPRVLLVFLSFGSAFTCT